jgi:hypothetical protein
MFYADGRRIRVEPSTTVVYKLNKSEKKAAEEEAKKLRAAAKKDGKDAKQEPTKDDTEKKGDDEQEEEDDDADARPLQSLDQIGAGAILTYEGTVQLDGVILAGRIEFMRNELEKGEADMWKSLKVQEKFQALQPGELKIDKAGKFKLLPNREVQEYVSRLGDSLIPAYQKQLPEGDPLKIPFRFYAVIDKNANAFALPNGIIVINTGLLDLLENEAQLAAVVSHEISHSVQEHSWRQQRYHRKKRLGLAIGAVAATAFGAGGIADLLGLVELAIRNGYQRTLDNQADRVGLGYMVSAGYDPREAPRVWKLMAKKYGDRGTDFFYSSHENHTTRRSYLMVEIRNNYSHLDYDAVKKNENEYQKVVGLVRESTVDKKKAKVK